ncbi:Aste57867_14398 [Aphanomyces stellatus]|uniref:Aste57867_14398 protein n=1 Tax=Aphanomyces stellatus TaxID=120398 RepID=A0A485L0I3_9STRA|nr:hypothetical protein As57867_014344 [Aphanomyces stellatus]VFT91220.1 Aste57867_14398 [Aphanomyces stellatus]
MDPPSSSTRPPIRAKKATTSTTRPTGTRLLHSILSIRLEKARSWREPENRLGPREYWRFYAAIALLHAAFATHLAVLAYAHAYLSSGNHEYERRTMQLPSDMALPVGVCVAVGGLHAGGLVLMVHNRRLRQRISRLGAPKATSKRGGFEFSSPILRALDGVYTRLWADKGLFGTQGELFGLRASIQHGASVASQTYQAYVLSLQSATVSLNWLVAASIGVSCVASPLLFMVRWRPIFQRTTAILLTVLVTAFLECGVPWLALVPYLPYFTWPVVVQNAHLYDEVWFYDAALLGQRLFLTNSGDIVSRMLPCVMAFLSLQYVETIVSIAHDSHVFDQRHSRHRASVYAVGGLPPTVPSHRRLDSARPLPRRPSAFLHHAIAYSRVLGLVWGLGVVGLTFVYSTTFTTTPCSPGCLTRVYPWFASDCRCVVQLVNCYQRRLTDAAAVATALAALHPGSLRLLIVEHCVGLVVPSSLRRFQMLTGLEVSNSTIAGWDASVASLPSLQYIMLVQTNLSVIPPGLIALPPSLLDLEIAGALLTALAPDILAAWAGLNTLYVERAQLTQLPSNLGQLTQLNTLSFFANDIADLSTFPPLPLLLELDISQNARAAALPTSPPPNLITLHAEYTSLATCAWLDQMGDPTSFVGSPLCTTAADNIAAVCTHTPSDQGMVPATRKYRAIDYVA